MHEEQLVSWFNLNNCWSLTTVEEIILLFACNCICRMLKQSISKDRTKINTAETKLLHNSPEIIVNQYCRTHM